MAEANGCGVRTARELRLRRRERAGSQTSSPNTRRAGRRARCFPLLYIVQSQMKRQTGSAWVPREAMDEVARLLGHAADPRLRGRTFYFMFNTAADRASSICRSARRRRAGCAARTKSRRACEEHRHPGWGETSADGDVHHDRGGVPRRLRQCADAPGERRFLRGSGRGRADERLLAALKRGEPPKPGSMTGGRPRRPKAGRRR